MRETTKQRSIRLPERVDAILDDLIMEGAFSNRTEAIIEGILRLYEELTVTESEVTLRLKLPRGDFHNLTRLKQLDGGTEETWAQRLVNLYAFEHARVLAEQAEEWETIFERKRRLEGRTESMAEYRRR